MPYLADLTDSDIPSSSIYTATLEQRRTSGNVTTERIRRSFIQRRFQFDRSILPITRDDARPFVTKSNLVMCSGKTIIDMVAFENVSSVKVYDIGSGQAVFIGAGQAVIAGPAEGANDSWVVPTWSLVKETVSNDEDDISEEGITASLSNLKSLTQQIESLTPLSRSNTLLNLAKEVKPSPPLSEGGIARWARKLAKDISGASD